MSDPRFKVGQIVVMGSMKRELPFRILKAVEHDGEWCYAWNSRNYASEHMLRGLTKAEKGDE